MVFDDQCQAQLLIIPSDGVREEVQRTSRSLFYWKLFHASVKFTFLERMLRGVLRGSGQICHPQNGLLFAHLF